MVALLRDRSRRANTIALCIIAAFGLIAAYASVALSGTKTGAVLSLVTTIGPALLYAALSAPLLFPFSFYVALVPFDSILDIGSSAGGGASGTVTRVLGVASAAALLFYMLRTKRAVEPPRATAFWILLYLWMAASIFWAIDPPSAEQLLPTALQLFGLYIVTAMMPLNMMGLRQITAATAIGGIASAMYGLYMYHTGAGIFKERLFIHTDTSAMNPDHFAASLVLPIAVCLIGALYARSIFVRAGAIFGLAAMLATVEVTGSRGAYLALGVVLLYLIWRDRHRWQLITVGAVLSAAALAVSGPQYFLQRWALAGVNGGAGRVSIWKTGLIAFRDNWLYGAGYNNFPFAYDRAFMQTFQAFYASWHRASHNILLGTAVELGVIGLALLLLAWYGQFKLLAVIPPDDARYPLRLGLEASLLGLFVCGLFADIMIWKYVWLAFMLVVLTRNTTPIRKEIHPHA